MAGICFLVARQEEAAPLAPGFAAVEEQKAPAE
jgi:hypothetical protein